MRVKPSLFLATTLLWACHSDSPSGGATGVPKLQEITFWNKTASTIDGDLGAQSRDYVVQAPELTGPGDDWVIRDADTNGRGGTQHVRLHQLHDGIRVWGGDLVVHANGVRFTKVVGNLVANLDGFDTKPTLDATAAMSAGKADYTAKLKSMPAGLAFSRESSELVIYPVKGRDARLAWLVVFYTEAQGGMPPGLWNYFVDAKDGTLLNQFNNVMTLEQASGPGGNAKVARTWTQQLDVDADTTDPTLFAMNTSTLQTVDMHSTTVDPGTIVTGPLDPIGDAPINDAHGFAEQTLQMLKEWQGFNSIDNNGFIIKSRVHYDVAFENAFWDGTQMTYGDGATTFFPLSGDIDVVAHEINHGFTQFHSNLIYQSQSGGMNESFSDIAGTTTQFFAQGDTADFDIGKDIFKGDTALRFMCNPTQDGVSIDDARNFNESLDVHFSSGVMNKAFCLAATRLAGVGGKATAESVRRAATAWYTANASFWTESSTFTQGCQGVMDASTALGFSQDERDILRGAWKDVGVFCDGEVEPIQCDETFTTDSGEFTSPNFPADYPVNFTHTWCIKPTSGQPATLTFPSFTTEANFDFVQIKDGSGTVLSNTSGAVAPAPATAAFLIVKFTSDVTVTAAGFHATWTTGTADIPPGVAFTAPAPNSTLSGVVSIQANATDADGSVSKVVFALPDGTSVEDTVAPFGAVWNSATVADGVYTITATAFDNFGVASEPATVSVDVHNSVPCLDKNFTAAGLPIAIPDNNTTGIASLIGVDGAGRVGSVALSLHITHPWRGDLRVVLVSPDGFQQVVHDRDGGANDDLVIDGLVVPAFEGRVAAGTWMLRVTDNAGGDVGTLDAWSLAVVGNCAPPGDYSGKAEPNLPLVDNGSACSTITIAGQTGDASTARLDVSGIHDFRSVLRGTLTHNGVTVDAFPVNTFPVGAGGFDFGNRPIPGLAGDVNGDWTVCIVDTDAFGDTGTLQSWSVHD
jgi:pseudolysin/vibriolysin